VTRARRIGGLEGFCRRYPVLFHVTDPGALPGIEQDGLLSSEALVALYGVPASERPALLRANRGRNNFHRLQGAGCPGATLRDQWMPDPQLGQCLRGGYAGRPDDWRALINAHCFFWLSAEQAGRLSRANRARNQVVLRFDAASLLAEHGSRASTTPINAGIALGLYGRPGSPRDEHTFRPVDEFPRGDGKAPKELAVLWGVPDAWRFRLAD